MTSASKRTLKLRPSARRGPASVAAHGTQPKTVASPRTDPAHRAASNETLLELVDASLWPMVSTAFRGVDDHVEARFLQLEDLQVVIARELSGKGRPPPADEAHLSLEVWSAAGPRVLQMEWRGRQPRIVRVREGDWVAKLLRAARHIR